MFVFLICFVDISKVKGFKDCKDSPLCHKVQEEVSTESVSGADSDVHENYIW